MKQETLERIRTSLTTFLKEVRLADVIGVEVNTTERRVEKTQKQGGNAYGTNATDYKRSR